MLRRVDWYIVTDVSKVQSTFLGLLYPEDKHGTIFRNVGNILPVDTA